MNRFIHFLCCVTLVGCLSFSAAQTSTRDTVVRLKAEDVINVSVYKEPDLSATTRILRSGNVSLPLIGSVSLLGLTVSEAADKVRDLYAEKYLVDPKVTLTITQYGVEAVSVMGEVRSPGQFSIPTTGRFDLAAAVAAAGGLGPEADRNSIKVYRSSGQVQTFSDGAIKGGASVPLNAGDRVVVGQSPFIDEKVSMMGQVRRPGEVQFPLTGKLDILTALARAGGFTQMANPKRVAVNRGGNTIVIDVKKLTESGNERIYLQPGDIVTVPESIW
ncbi:MAG: polysaccharide biosynthesis/export family protein [Verrucomicrobiales bacterium]